MWRLMLSKTEIGPEIVYNSSDLRETVERWMASPRLAAELKAKGWRFWRLAPWTFPGGIR